MQVVSGIRCQYSRRVLASSSEVCRGYSAFEENAGETGERRFWQEKRAQRDIRYARLLQGSIAMGIRRR
jgi:hypothetical protein